MEDAIVQPGSHMPNDILAFVVKKEEGSGKRDVEVGDMRSLFVLFHNSLFAIEAHLLT